VVGDIGQPQYYKCTKKNYERENKTNCDIIVDQCHQYHQLECHPNATIIFACLELESWYFYFQII